MLFVVYSSCLYRRRQWHPTPVLLPGKSHGQRSLVGCSPWGREDSDTTERLHFHFSLSCIGEGNGNPLQCSCLRIPGTGEPGGLLSMRLHRVGHDWSDLAAAFFYFLKIQGCILFLSLVFFCFCFFSLFLVRRVSSRYCFNGWFCFALYFTNNSPFCGFQTSLSMGLCSAL